MDGYESGKMRIRDYSGAGGSGQLRSGRQTARFPQLADLCGKMGKMLEAVEAHCLWNASAFARIRRPAVANGRI
jgi:hypothetical protein